ncbi:MAG: glycoside hydrolase, partial [Bacteroidia bacterium]|nr:glycoside hydrolase [Bacteroidia bacterium]
SYSVGYNNNKMQDKPWLSTDIVSEKSKGNVYVTWTEFDKYNSSAIEDRSRIRFSRYTPKTDTFSEGITISDTTGDCLDGDNTLEGATTAIGKNGDIYAVWAGHNKIWFDKSFDGGVSWNKDIEIAEQTKGWEMEMPNIFRANGMPFIQCDTERNIIYVCWADEFEGNADIWLKYSKDQGRSWSKRVRLNKDSTASHQYFPNMAINKATGEILVAFYDQRHSSLNVFYDIYLASFSVDSNLKNYRITQKSIPLPGADYFYGDYVDLDIQNNLLAVVYPTFSLDNSSDIEVALVYNFPSQYVNPTTKVNGINVLKNKDSSFVYINEQYPYSLKLKVKSGKLFGVKKKVIRIKKEDVQKDRDLQIGTFPFTSYYKLKYTLINLDNKQKFKHKF